MGVLCDQLIKEFAEKGMIAPFFDKQISSGVISYGLSSYGYDIRVANEFKVFTNAYCTTVDPKKFNPDNFVDIKDVGDVLIPPNSFALARSVEYIKMPRSVFSLVVGKCLTGDTRIIDANTGNLVKIKDAIGISKTIGYKGHLPIIANTSNFFDNGIKQTFLIKTRLGLEIKATDNHPFLTIHGWKNLKDLKIGDRIAVPRIIDFFGTNDFGQSKAALLGFLMSDGQCCEPTPVFTSSDNVLVKAVEDSAWDAFECKISQKGKMGYSIVNKHGRGGIPTKNRVGQWLRELKLNVLSIDKFIPPEIFMSSKECIRTFLRALFSGDGGVSSRKIEYYTSSKQLVYDVRHLLLRFGIFGAIRSKKTYRNDSYMICITDPDMIRKFYNEIGFWPNSKKQKKLDIIVNGFGEKKRDVFDTLPSYVWHIMKDALKTSKFNANKLGFKYSFNQSVPMRLAKLVADVTNNETLVALTRDNAPVWDKIKSIESNGLDRTFDIEVPETSNFIANDIIVHNSTYARCGIIINVTPIEPGWEGYITIEISNTTPLPARIYANEGIAQMVFLSGNVLPLVTYDERDGKYQYQTGITLPIVK